MLLPGAIFLLGITSCEAQIPNAQKVAVEIYGNCGMCKKTIEKAGYQKNKSMVVWDKETKKATVTFNPQKTTVAKVLKRIANAGYDNEQYYAPDNAYEELHGCCQYERKPKE